MRRIWLWRVTNLVGFFYLIKGFVHCDLKLQKILVFDNGKVKITDFGLPKKEEQKQSNEVKRAELKGRSPVFGLEITSVWVGDW